jgi:formaldehyde-activating enzyme involved in methanogenesis
MTGRRLFEAIVAAALVVLFVGGALLIARTYTLAEDIQQNRVSFIRDECEDVNQRHDNTIAALDAVLKQAIEDHPERAERIEESRTSTVLLINALVPVRDCDERVQLATP